MKKEKRQLECLNPQDCCNLNKGHTMNETIQIMDFQKSIIWMGIDQTLSKMEKSPQFIINLSNGP